MKNETKNTIAKIILFGSFLAVTALCFFGAIKASEENAELFEQCIRETPEKNCEAILF